MKHEALLFGAAAVLVRLAWVLLVPTHPVGDFAMYLESADYLRAHGALDPEFIYMPGYVLLLAGVRALGGGLFACKLLGVAAGGAVAAAAHGIADAVFDRASARAAGMLAALWPAGIAVASVTGTDMPAAALLAVAVWMLVRDGRARPLRASVLFGLFLGLGATIRAVALPAAALATFYWVAVRAPVRQVALRTAVGCGVAFLVLLPWGIRNQLRYGEAFLTDSHGGHTAMVGANPNSEGVYSRSLNQMFAKGTSYKLFAEPHRAADRRAYEIARAWSAFDPAYAIGLLAAKADRLLTHERPLLYWPLYRQGVLRGETAAWFARHRAGLEAFADGFWYALVAATIAGIALAAASRRGLAALSLLPIPLALTALYVAFFAEVRYHLAIAAFFFPYAGYALTRIPKLLHPSSSSSSPSSPPARHRRFVLPAAAALAGALVVLAWPHLVGAGAALRARHRWAVCVCQVAGKGRLCSWRGAPAPLRGIWDGIGIAVRPAAPAPAAAPARATTELDNVPAGRYELALLADAVALPVGASPRLPTRVTVAAGGAPVAAAILAGGTEAAAAPLVAILEHRGGPLRLEISVEPKAAAPPPAEQNFEPPPNSPFDPFTIWISGVTVTAAVAHDL